MVIDMINKETFDKIFEKALQYASAYQSKFESSLESVENSDIVVAYSGLLIAMIQEVYIKSVPGESLNDIQQMKEIVDLIFDKAKIKVAGWDAKREKNAKIETHPAVEKILKNISGSIKRSPDDRLN